MRLRTPEKAGLPRGGARAALVVWLVGAALVLPAAWAQPSLISDETLSRQSAQLYGAWQRELAATGRLAQEAEPRERVAAIANRLIAQAVRFRPAAARWDWQLMIIQDDVALQAFCFPGGQMGLSTGMLRTLKATDDEIAHALAHEMAHALVGHGLQKMTVHLASQAAASTLSLFEGKGAADARREEALVTGAKLFAGRPHSASSEPEADRVGLELAARAGFDPQAAPTLWRKLADAFGTRTPEFAQAHPDSGLRAYDLQQLLPAMSPIHAAAVAHPAPRVDWLGLPPGQRPPVDESQAVPYHSAQWEVFKAGRVELRGDGSGFAAVKGVTAPRRLADLYARRHWRDLASEVMELDLRLDLTYHYLGRAALGMGFEEAGRAYLARARELSGRQDTACLRKTLWSSCGGLTRIGAE